MTTAMEQAFNEAQATESVDVTTKPLTTSGQEIVDQLAGKDTVAQRVAQERPEPTADDSEYFQKLVQKTPWWVSDYFTWKTNAAGKYYLAPTEDVLEMLIKAVPSMIKAGYDKVYPDSGGPTQEAESVDRRVAAYTELDQDDAALNWNNMVIKRRTQLRDECIVRALYAARTQYELDGWATRMHQQKKPLPDTFDEKKNRGLEQGMQAGAFYALMGKLPVVRDNKGREISVNDQTINRIVRNRMWEDARFRTNEVLNPRDEEKNEEALTDSDRIHVSMFD